MIFLLNGPPSSGKDTAAEFIILMLGNSKVHHLKMSRPLKNGIRAIFDFNDTEMKVLNAYKDDTNGPEFGDMSYRQMQIALFGHLKEAYGPDVFGKTFVRAAKNIMKPHIVVSDAGMEVEVQYLVNHYPYGKIGLIQLHRPDCNFDNDIREYVSDKGFKYSTVIYNKYDLELFQAQIRRVLVKWEFLNVED